MLNDNVLKSVPDQQIQNEKQLQNAKASGSNYRNIFKFGKKLVF
jgi:hypothetical protein